MVTVVLHWRSLICHPGGILFTRYFSRKIRGVGPRIDDIPFQGNEKILDMGCGHGTVLIAAAQRIPHGTATGIDLWRFH